MTDLRNDDSSVVLHEHIWNNKHIKIDKKSFFYKTFYDCNINTIGDLCDAKGAFSWEIARSKGLQNSDFMKWAGIIHAIPKAWKQQIKMERPPEENDGLYQRDVCLTFKGKNIDIRQISTREIYNFKVEKLFKPPTAQLNLCNRMQVENIDWNIIYSRIYSTTVDSYLRFFQYKVLNNILYLNRDLYRFKLLDNASSCSFCSIQLETIDHLFVECIETKNLYFQIRVWLGTYNVYLPEISKVNIILGVDDITTNFIILLFKYCLYKGRDSKRPPSLPFFQNLLCHYEKIELLVAKTKNLIDKHNDKWKNVKKALLYKDI